jgi:hypothetical protein
MLQPGKLMTYPLRSLLLAGAIQFRCRGSPLGISIFVNLLYLDWLVLVESLRNCEGLEYASFAAGIINTLGDYLRHYY